MKTKTKTKTALTPKPEELGTSKWHQKSFKGLGRTS
jgi:hypothetical protein